MIHALCMCGLHKVEKVITVMSNPRQYKIPDWFLNRQKDVKDGKYSQALSNVLDSKIREDLERLKKIRAHRGLRHYWGSVHGVCRVLLSSRGADCKVL